MAQNTRKVLKTYFEIGDIPTQGQYADLIDSQLNLIDPEEQTVASTVNFGTTFQNTSTISTLKVDQVLSNLLIKSPYMLIASGTALFLDSISASADFSSSGKIETTEIIQSSGIKLWNSAYGVQPFVSPLADYKDTFFIGMPPGGGDLILKSISASGDISASGTIFADNFTSVGGDENGINFTDGVKITGDITASGNISASGTVFADNFESSGGDDQITFTDNLFVDGNITSSKVISASGAGFNTFAGHIDSDGFFRAGNGYGLYGYNNAGDAGKSIALINSSDNILFSNNDCITKVFGSSVTLDAVGSVVLDSDTGTIQFRDGGFTRIEFDTTSGHIEASGNITASGNISASGTIISQTGSFSHIEGNSDITIKDNVIFQTNISMSAGLALAGNVSASGGSIIGASTNIDGNAEFGGSVTAGEGTFTAIDTGDVSATNITASGKISASGDMCASNIYITGSGTSGTGSIDYLFIYDEIRGNADGVYKRVPLISVETLSAASLSLMGNGTVTGDLTINNDLKLKDDGKIIQFSNDNTHITSTNGNQWIFTCNNTEVFRIQNSAFTINNNSNGITDFLIKGDNDATMFFANSATDKVGIGTNTPDEKLTVVGNVSASGNLTIDGSQVDFTNLPTSDPSVAGRLWNSGSYVKISAG